MNYLDPSEYEAYGLEETTPASLIAAASALMDAHCRRETLIVQQYTERLRLSGRANVRVTYLPLTEIDDAPALVSLRARYGVPRRGDANDLACEAGIAFGLTGGWTTLAVENIDYDSRTGEITLPTHPLGLPYRELEVSYTAGVKDVPGALKCACAQIVRNAEATPALNVRTNGIDRMQMSYFSDSLLDEGVRKLLAPYVAQKVG
jgi:hypothetical protein